MIDMVKEALQESEAWEKLSYEEKNEKLFEKQKHLLKQFLERHAISREQYEKSLHDLTEKTGHEKIRRE